MNFMRQHWFDVGLVFAFIVSGFLFISKLNPLSFLLWVSLISLFLHQFEEYRYPGYFPTMMNTVMFSSKQPDRYPLNPNTAFIINVLVGWLSYFLAALLGEKTLWLGIATMLVSVGNFVAHTFIFNIKGKTCYNPGMFTAVLLFMPIAVYFFYWLIQGNFATLTDWILGLVLGGVVSYVGILKLIEWIKDENTRYTFPKRFRYPIK
jgi:hypothetical protein